MATKAELKKKLDAARQAKNSASKALKNLADVRAPKGARKALKALRARLRAIRKAMVERIPVLKHRLEAKRHNGGAKAADAFAKYIGITENPPYSNKGPFPISAGQKFIIGYDGVPYCGCVAGYFAIKEGGAHIPNKARLAYVPYIKADAQAKSNGLVSVPLSQVRRGDLICFDFDGGVADHVGMAAGPIVNGMTDCYEANTSPSSAGSQSNGGGLFRRQRPISQVACVARPDYS